MQKAHHGTKRLHSGYQINMSKCTFDGVTWLVVKERVKFIKKYVSDWYHGQWYFFTFWLYPSFDKLPGVITHPCNLQGFGTLLSYPDAVLK